jgi:hypothetical protein
MVKQFYSQTWPELIHAKLSNPSILLGFLSGIKKQLLLYDRKNAKILSFSIYWSSACFCRIEAVRHLIL